jgi:hypothetical protein
VGVIDKTGRVIVPFGEYDQIQIANGWIEVENDNDEVSFQA